MKSRNNSTQQEDELRKFEYIVSISEELMSFIGPDYAYQAVNEAYLKAHNKKREDIVNHTIAELHGEDVFKNIIKQQVDRCFAGETVKYEDWFELSGAGRLFMDVTYYPYKSGENGRATGVAVIARDITAKKQFEDYKKNAERELSENQKSLKKAQKIASIGSWDWDLTTDTVNFSDEYYHLFGFESNECATREQCLARIHPDDLEVVNQAVDDALEGAGHYSIDYRINLPDGQQKNVHGMGEVELDQNNKPIRFVGTVHNITEYKLAEERLRSALVLNEEVISSSPIGISIYNETGQCIAANTSIAKMVGATKEQALVQNYNEIESWKKSGLLESAKKCIRQQAKERHEFDVVTTFGKHAFYDCTFMPFQMQGKKHLLLMLDDVSERKHAEELQKQSQKQLNEAQRIAKVGSWTLDLRTNQLVWSDEIFRIFEIEKHLFDASYGAFLDAIHPDDREMVDHAYTESVANHLPYDITHRLLLSNGRTKYVREICETLYDNEGTPVLSRGTVQDISQQFQAEREIEQTKKEWNYAMDFYDEPIYLLDLETRVIRANKAFYKLTHSSESEVIGHHIADILHPEGEEAPCPICRVQEEHRDAVIVMEADHPDNLAGIPIEVICRMIRDQNDQPAGTLMTIRDLSRARKTDESLRLSQAVFDNTAEGILITDTSLNIVSINPAFTKITGYSSEEVMGKNPNILESLAQEPDFYKNMWKTINAGKTWHGSLVDRKKDGSFYPALMTIVPILDEARHTTHFIATQQDMTEYRRLEDQFHEAQKMESLGTLVGGIAHDFNNMLGGIMGNVYFAKQRIGTDERLINNIEVIDKLCARAADVVKQLLIFARKDQVIMSDFSLTDLLNEGILLIQTSIPENIELEVDISSEQLFIKGNTTQLQQVLMNLFINARDALEDTEQPKIICRLDSYCADDAFKKRYPEAYSNKFALLSIRDNGTGIRQEIIDRIFDPFFSTKEVGKGTGLGLAMVYGAIISHKGVIEVDSEAEKGTVFNIYLPLSQIKNDEQATTKYTQVKANGELILVADDNRLLRMITEEALLDLGYRVIAASDGEDALNLYLKNRNEIALVILDIVMPKINGVNVALSMRELDKNLPIIFATGYDKNETHKEQQKIENSVLLSKPFSPEKLNQVIERCLENI